MAEEAISYRNWNSFIDKNIFGKMLLGQFGRYIFITNLWYLLAWMMLPFRTINTYWIVMSMSAFVTHIAFHIMFLKDIKALRNSKLNPLQVHWCMVISRKKHFPLNVHKRRFDYRNLGYFQLTIKERMVMTFTFIRFDVSLKLLMIFFMFFTTEWT